MDWLALLPFTLLTVGALLLLEFRSGKDGGDWQVNCQAWAINTVVGLTVVSQIPSWAGPALVDGAALPVWLAIALFIVVQDLGEYLFHRAQHRIPLLWQMHSLHHSDPDMSVLTASRHFWGDQLLKNLTVWSLSAMVIAPTGAALVAYFMVSLWHHVAHSNLRIDFGRWSWLLITPTYHRRHHSMLPEHCDSNFSALFPIFDVIAGSYHRPEGYPPTGLAQRPRTLAELLWWPLLFGRRNAQPGLESQIRI